MRKKHIVKKWGMLGLLSVWGLSTVWAYPISWATESEESVAEMATETREAAGETQDETVLDEPSTRGIEEEKEATHSLKEIIGKKLTPPINVTEEEYEELVHFDLTIDGEKVVEEVTLKVNEEEIPVIDGHFLVNHQVGTFAARLDYRDVDGFNKIAKGDLVIPADGAGKTYTLDLQTVHESVETAAPIHKKLTPPMNLTEEEYEQLVHVDVQLDGQAVEDAFPLKIKEEELLVWQGQVALNFLPGTYRVVAEYEDTTGRVLRAEGKLLIPKDGAGQIYSLDLKTQN